MAATLNPFTGDLQLINNSASTIANAIGLSTSGVSDAQASQLVANILQQAAYNDTQIMTALGVIPASALVYESGTGAGSLTFLSSTFSGWGTAIGQPSGSFNSVEFDIQAWDSTSIPTFIRCRVRSTDQNGTLLADVTQTLPNLGVNSSLFNTSYRVHIDLGVTIVPAGALWVEYFTDGHTGAKLLTAPTTYATTTMYATNKSYVAPVFANSSANSNIYVRCLTSSVSNGYSIDVPAGFPYTSSTFAGWGFPVGAPGNFNRVEFDINPFDPGNLPQNLRCRILTNNQSGTLLADKTISIAVTNTATFRVAVDFDFAINGGSTNLWLEFVTDGYCGFRATNTNPYTTSNGYALGRYTTTKGLNAFTTNNVVSEKDLWAIFKLISPAQRLTGSVDAQTKLMALVASQVAPVISLPGTIYAIRGLETTVYFENIVRAVLPESHYTYVVTCNRSGTDIGQYQGGNATQGPRWVVTPGASDVGSWTWKLDIYWSNIKVSTKTCTLVIKAATTSGITRKVVSIGDSTTIPGYTLSELVNLGNTDFGNGAGGLTVSTQGTISVAGINDAGTDGNGTGATSRTVKTDAVSGKDINYFYTNASSPFVLSGSFNFSNYLSANSITLSSSDWVMFLLGINDLFSYTDDLSAYAKIATMATQLSAMITNIKAAVSGIRIGIGMVSPPSYEQNSFGNNYGNSQTRWRYNRNICLWREYLLTQYDNALVANVFLIPLHAQWDIRNNMQTTAGNLNYYNHTQLSRQSNGVHPSNTAIGNYGCSANAIVNVMRGQEA